MTESLDNSMNSALSILVVDDDELNQRMMRLLLKRDGHQVECASNGQEAFEAVKSRSYDIVLMDLQMPVMDGLEASRCIREWEADGRHTFIVALTASFMPEKGRELFEVGIDNYMSKPFEVEHLRNILQHGLEKRNARSETAVQPPGIAISSDEQGFDYQIGILRVGGDAETYKELLSDFVDGLPARVETMHACFKNKDMIGLYRAAHNLKGVSSNLGALQLSEHARRLEKQVSESYTELIESMIGDISRVSGKLKESFSGFLLTGN